MVQPAQDIFGLGRLAGALRQRRQEERQAAIDAQNALTAGLQRQNLALGIQEREMRLSDLARQQADQDALSQAFAQAPEGQDPDFTRLSFLKQRNPQAASQLQSQILGQVGNIAKLDPAATTRMANQKLGLDLEFQGKQGDLLQIGTPSAGKVLLYDPGTDQVVKEFAFDTSAGSGPNFQLKEGVDAHGNPTFFRFNPETGEVPAGISPKLEAGEVIETTPDGGVRITRGTGTGLVTKGRTQADKEFAKEFAKIVTGGFSDQLKQINQLEGAVDALESGQNLTGPAIGLAPDFILNVFKPEAVDVRERVEEVVQRNLREILGAQFTEKEGERLIKRAFNPALEEDVNIRRVKNLLNQMKIAIAQKRAAAAHFQREGTLTGFDGELPTMDDFKIPEDDGQTSILNFDSQGNLIQ